MWVSYVWVVYYLFLLFCWVFFCLYLWVFFCFCLFCCCCFGVVVLFLRGGGGYRILNRNASYVSKLVQKDSMFRLILLVLWNILSIENFNMIIITLSSYPIHYHLNKITTYSKLKVNVFVTF